MATMNIPEKIKKLIDVFASLPSIGPRQATRLAFYLLNAGASRVSSLKEALVSLQTLHQCPSCFFYFEASSSNAPPFLCEVCREKNRNKKQICIIEKETDLLSIEQGGGYTGAYFILGGHLSYQNADKKTPRGSQHAKAHSRLAYLIQRIQKDFCGKAEEIILAINPTAEGDITALYLKQHLAPYTEKITRLARGLPTGGDIEFADDQTLQEAFKNRK